MSTQIEPLDLSNKSDGGKLLSILDVKFLTGLNGHLTKLYERSGFANSGGKGTSLSRRNACAKNVLPCQVCLKTFDRPSLLKRHMRTHTGEKPHVCGVCGKGFSTSSSLNTHKRIHTGEKPHKCPECGKCFTASSNLYYHRMTHTKNKPHKCSVCPRSFPTPGELRSHMAAHNARGFQNGGQISGENGVQYVGQIGGKNDVQYSGNNDAKYGDRNGRNAAQDGVRSLVGNTWPFAAVTPFVRYQRTSSHLIL